MSGVASKAELGLAFTVPSATERRHAAPSPPSCETEQGATVPEISRFLGIVIGMYFDDHAPPHIHARNGGVTAKFEIASGAMISGKFPIRARRLVREWVSLHRNHLFENWQLAKARRPLHPVEPLE